MSKPFVTPLEQASIAAALEEFYASLKLMKERKDIEIDDDSDLAAATCVGPDSDDEEDVPQDRFPMCKTSNLFVGSNPALTPAMAEIVDEYVVKLQEAIRHNVAERAKLKNTTLHVGISRGHLSAPFYVDETVDDSLGFPTEKSIHAGSDSMCKAINWLSAYDSSHQDPTCVCLLYHPPLYLPFPATLCLALGATAMVDGEAPMKNASEFANAIYTGALALARCLSLDTVVKLDKQDPFDTNWPALAISPIFAKECAKLYAYVWSIVSKTPERFAKDKGTTFKVFSHFRLYTKMFHLIDIGFEIYKDAAGDYKILVSDSTSE